jgi:hypothetical protein
VVIVCAWCRRVLEQKPPLNLIEISHGICPPCMDSALRNTPRRRARSVIVVLGDDYELYGHLLAAFAPIPDILVLLDRRRSDRRRFGNDVAVERRNSDRRARPLRPLMETVGVLLG